MMIRGVNVFPSQIETVLLKEGYSPNYQIIVDRHNNNDTLDINLELSPEMFSEHHVNVEYMYAFVTMSKQNAYAVIRVEDDDKAIALLEKHHIQPVTEEDIAKL